MAARFWVLGTGTWDASDTTHWATSSGAGSGGASVPGPADAVTIDASSGAGTITVNTNFNVTSLTTDAMTMTLDFSANNNSPTMQTFRSSGSGVRTINAGSGTWSITGNAATVWSTSTATNLTWTQTGAINFTYSGATGTRTLSVANTTGGSETNSPSISITAGTDIVLIGSGSMIKDLSFLGFSGTLNNNSRTLYGNLTISPTMTTTASTLSTTFAATSGTKTIISNGTTMDFPIIINGIGGTFKAVDTFIMGSTRTLTLTNGTFDGNGATVSVGFFSSSNSNVRSIIFGSGQWTVTGFSGSVWNTGTSTNATITPGLPVITNYSGSTGTRTISTGTVADVPQANAISFRIIAGSDIVTNSSTRAYGSLDFTGFSGSWTTLASSFYGNLIMPTGMGQTVASIFTFIGTATKTISTNANPNVVLSLVLNGSSGQVNLGSTFLTSGSITITAGGFTTANYNVTCGSFSSSNSNTRSITLGNSTVALTTSGTVWDTATTTGLTFTPGTSTIKLTDSTPTAKTFSPGGLTFNNIWLSGTGTGAMILGTTTTAQTFNNFRVDPGLTVNFFEGGTTNVTSLSIVGTSGNRITLQSTTNGIVWNIVSRTGIPLTVQYTSIRDSNATPPFFIAIASTNVGNNTGWLFKPISAWTDVPKPSNIIVSSGEGQILGLLMAITYGSSSTTISGWTDVAKATGTSWTDVNKPSSTSWSKVN